MIKVSGLCKTYESGPISTEIFNNFSIDIKKNEKVAIMGPSGSGKSTLLHILAGLEKYESGKVIVDGVDYLHEKDSVIEKIRLEKYGFVHQKSYLIDSLNVYDNIIIPALALKKVYSKDRVNELLDILQISNRKKFYPSQLSGGEQQRVCIARALVNDPKIVFADEPTGSLDKKNSEIVIELLCKCCEKDEKTLVLVTHDERISEYLQRKILFVE